MLGAFSHSKDLWLAFFRQNKQPSMGLRESTLFHMAVIAFSHKSILSLALWRGSAILMAARGLLTKGFISFCAINELRGILPMCSLKLCTAMKQFLRSNPSKSTFGTTFSLDQQLASFLQRRHVSQRVSY